MESLFKIDDFLGTRKKFHSLRPRVTIDDKVIHVSHTFFYFLP